MNFPLKKPLLNKTEDEGYPIPSSSFSSQGVVICEKDVMNLQLFGAISNGNATIPLSHNKALKITRGNDFKLQNGKPAYMVKIQVIEAGIGSSIAYQSWNRTKTVVKKETVIKEVIKKPIKPLKEFVHEGTEEF
jgi:hypothetical protein